MIPEDENPIIFADVVQSLNYVEPTPSTTPYSVTGTRLDLATGTITAPGLFVDGTTGAVAVRGDITAESFSIIDSVGNVSARWSTSVDALGPYPLDGLMFSADTWRTGILSGQTSDGSIPGYISMEAQNDDGRTARVFAFNEQVGLEAFDTASAGSTLYVNSGTGGIILNAGTGTVELYGAGLDVFAPITEDSRRVVTAGSGEHVLQSAATSVALNASGRGTITFPVAFTANPSIVATVVLSTAAEMTCHVVSKTTTDFVIQVFAGGALAASVTRQINWLATGPV